MASDSRLRSILVADEPAEGPAGADEESAGPPSTIGRLLYAGVLALTAVDNLRNLEDRAGYAESKDVPLARAAVPLASTALLAGSAGIALWRYPRAAALSIVAFLAGVTPTMHDYWNHEGQRRETEQFQFLKNVAMLGTAVMLFRRANADRSESGASERVGPLPDRSDETRRVEIGD